MYPVAETTIAALAPVVTAVSVATAMNFSRADAMSVAGAIIATCIAVIEARKKDRSLSHTVAVVISSASFGSFIPGLIAWKYGWIDLPWQAYYGLGFLAGLVGWWAVSFWTCWFPKFCEWYLMRQRKKFFPDSFNDKPNQDR